MARKKKKRTSRKSRRRGSSIGQIDVTGMLYSGVGGLAARLIDRIVPSTLDPKLVAAGKIAVGFAMPMLVKDAKTKKMLSDMGAGMVAVAVVDLSAQFGFMQGVIGTPPAPALVDELAIAVDDVDPANVGADVLGADVLGSRKTDVSSKRRRTGVINSVINGGGYQMQDRMVMS